MMLEMFIQEHHPEIKYPKRPKHDKLTPLQSEALNAVKATLLDLLRNTYVRDIHFTPFGHHEPQSEPKHLQKHTRKGVEYFEGAGNTPKYWFGDRKAD